MDNLGYDLMRPLVTGAQGFLGNQLVGFLKVNYENVISTGRRKNNDQIQCDLMDPKGVRNLIDNNKPDIIIHCAATVPKKHDDYNKNIYHDDLVMLSNIISKSSCPILFISSMTVYGKNLKKPVVEEDAGKPRTVYGKMKWDCENLLLSSNRIGYSIRIPGLFGLPRKSGIIYNLLYGVKYNKSIKLPDYPLAWASMYVNDAALSIIKLLKYELNTFKHINVGYAGKYSIDSLVDKINGLFNSNIKYNIVHPTFEFDLSKAISYNMEPKNSLDQAITTFYNQI